MRTSSIVRSVLLATALTGCSLEGAAPTAPDAGSGPYTDLPERQFTVSGVVYDPEVFFLSLATFPAEDPDDAPPPALFAGIPYLTRSAAIGASVSIMNGQASASASAPSAGNGTWQVRGVPAGEIPYVLRAVPPAEGLVMGAPDIFPPEIFGPIPEAKYHPTTTLNPVMAPGSVCHAQVAAVVGEAGALSAVAQLMTDMGTPTTPADLLDPSKTGGVALVWVYSPSPAFNFFDIPAPGIAAETDKGTLYAIDWAPPELGIPGQSPLGYMAIPDSVGPMGYFALVLPPGSSGPVTLRFNDTVTTPEGEDPGPSGPRPFLIPPFVTEVPSGVSFARLHAMGEAPPEDPLADPVPPPDFSWMCL
ncbi:hypothetical protein NR798_12690 [Archangium gephyra]|uniref:hypothetical protein n=1 Tax=Archangium gephyra TaxID=48 RepID=UPI0035D41DC5